MGSLNIDTMTDVEAQGYRRWKNQRDRCQNKNNLSYKYYGAKGVKVEYSSREFISWWVSESVKENYIEPTCGRINHDKNYSFDNIKIQEKAANSAETWTRNKRHARAIVVMQLNKIICICETGRQVEWLGYCKNNNLPKYIRNNITTRRGFNFKYYKAGA